MKTIAILYSDSGGGHRASAEALGNEIKEKYSNKYRTVLLDGLAQGAFPPFNRVSRLYGPIVTNFPWIWGTLFRLTNSRRISLLLHAQVDAIAKAGIRRLFIENDPELVVAVYPLLTLSPWRILKEIKPSAPFVTVVTDLHEPHASWFSAPSDIVFVPSLNAKSSAEKFGTPSSRVYAFGLPINRNFLAAKSAGTSDDSKQVCDLRLRQGLLPGVFTILLLGGGDGIGPIYRTARALAAIKLPIQLVIVAGRNARLREKLEERTWPIPVHTLGFVQEMHNWIRLADLVITKAGPGSIMECLAVGRPVLIHSFIPGLEHGNAAFVEENGVGVVCLSPELIAHQVEAWVTGDKTTLERMRKQAEAYPTTNAAARIVNLLDQVLSARQIVLNEVSKQK